MEGVCLNNIDFQEDRRTIRTGSDGVVRISYVVNSYVTLKFNMHDMDCRVTLNEDESAALALVCSSAVKRFRESLKKDLEHER